MGGRGAAHHAVKGRRGPSSSHSVLQSKHIWMMLKAREFPPLNDYHKSSGGFRDMCRTSSRRATGILWFTFSLLVVLGLFSLRVSLTTAHPKSPESQVPSHTGQASRTGAPERPKRPLCSREDPYGEKDPCGLRKMVAPHGHNLDARHVDRRFFPSKPLTVAERLRSILRTLKFTKARLNEAGIPYWLDGGTLLGALRKECILPWDADGDIAMELESYTVLKNVCKCPD